MKELILGLVLLFTALPSIAAKKVVNGAIIEDLPPPANDSITDGGVYFQERSLVSIPKEYGKILSIYPSAEGDVLWFESEDGTVRDVVLPKRRMLLIQRTGKLQRKW